MNRPDYEAVKARIDAAKCILVSGHLSPDGDALGSMIALSRLLRAYGKEAYATVDPPSLGKMRFMEGLEDFIPVRKLKRQRKLKFDLFIYVDCGDPGRLPPEVRGYPEKLPCVIFDHHDKSAGTAPVQDALSLADPSASSTCEVIWRFAKWLDVPFDHAIASALWTGIVTDTGRFAYEKCTSRTMMMASDLLSPRYGVRKTEINDIIFNRFSPKAIKLKQIAWRSLHVWKGGRVAEVTLTRSDFRSVRGTKADAEDAVEIPRQVARNEVAIYYYQIPDRTSEIRCSIRTRGSWNAADLAMKFGGGGHARAAGCTIKKSMGQAKRAMRAAIKEMLNPPKEPEKK